MRSDLARWAAVSAVTLVACEYVLMRWADTTYTDLYRSARRSPAGLVPLAVAGLAFAHLEGWIPRKVDPFYGSMGLFRRCRELVP